MTVINNYSTWINLCQLVNVQQNGQIPPSVFNGWYNEVNKQVFKDLAELFQTNQVMSDLLMPFRKVKLIQLVPQRGQNWTLLSVPADYEYFVGASTLTQEQEDECFKDSNLPKIDGDGQAQRYVDPDYAQMVVNFAGANINEGQLQLIDANRWQSCYNHKTKGPTLKDPKMTQFDQGFKVAPKGAVSCLLYYLSTPTDSVLTYTISDQDIAIYTPGTSIQLQWSDQVLPWFLALLVIKYGGYINDAGIVKQGQDMLMVVNKY